MRLQGAACQIVEKSLGTLNGSITAMFKLVKGSGLVTYSHKQHTRVQVQYTLPNCPSCCPCTYEVVSAEHVRWVAENLHPFKIVSDKHYLSSMKTGQPGYHVPSPETVS